METLKERIKFVRTAARLSQERFAESLGVTRGAVGNWELNGEIPTENLTAISQKFSTPLDWLATGRGVPPLDLPQLPLPPASTRSNARMGAHTPLSGLIPLYGHAAGGKDGSFILNGNKVSDILAPPALTGVKDAYAVYVVGDSMEPRYFSGETVFVNPRAPVRRGDFVVAQIATTEGETPLAFVKRFVGRDAKNLRLEQLNPSKTLEFPTKLVESVHRIVMGGDG